MSTVNDSEEGASANGSKGFLALERAAEYGLWEKMYRQFFALQQVARRGISSSVRRQVENKVPQKQKIFQEDNGLPVHLMGGTTDALLYRTTMALTVLGMGYGVFKLVKASFPEKKA